MLRRSDNLTKLWTFGDSWAAGHGLRSHEKKFSDVMSEKLSLHSVNKGASGSSLGQVLHTFKKFIKKIKKDDVVVVIIPPDIRWYNIYDNGFCVSLNAGNKEFNRFIKDKSPIWFIYHHSLFIYTFISICEQIGCRLVLAHNYGDLVLDPDLEHVINKDYFLDHNKCLTELLGGNIWRNNYHPSLEADGPPGTISGEMFIPGDTHPNEQGHQRIAEMLLEKLENYNVSNK